MEGVGLRPHNEKATAGLSHSEGAPAAPLGLRRASEVCQWLCRDGKLAALKGTALANLKKNNFRVLVRSAPGVENRELRNRVGPKKATATTIEGHRIVSERFVARGPPGPIEA